MILLTKYKEIEVGQLIREKKDWWIRIEYIEQDDSMMDKYPEKELVLVRVNLISVTTGKPHGSCTKSYQEIIDLINKPVETTNEQPKPATSSCGSEGCDHYKYDHICRCQ